MAKNMPASMPCPKNLPTAKAPSKDVHKPTQARPAGSTQGDYDKARPSTDGE